MISSVLDVLPSAVGVAISPLPIVSLILILMSNKAKANGVAFLAGWLIGLMIIGVIGLNLIDPDGGKDKHNPVVLWIQVIVGILVLVLAAKNWMNRPRTNLEPKMPKWMQNLSKMPWYIAFGLAIFFIVLNPKNLALALDGVTSIAEDPISTAAQYGTLIIYTLVASLSIAAPVVYYFSGGAGAKKLLSKLKGWLVKNNAVIMAVVLLLVGLKITIEAIAKLSA